MKKFLLKCLAFFGIVLSIMTVVLVFYGGYVDYFYEKFTTPKASSLILGDSRSLQGIQPRILNEYFEESDVELPMLNYSFTLKQIAYGAPYTESVKRKLDTNTKNGLFILSVHPFILSSRDREINEESKGVFFEAEMPPHNMKHIDMNPNYEYIYKNFNYFHFRGIFRKSSKVHKDGWLEERNLTDNVSILDTWKKNQISKYKTFAKKWIKSEIRLTHLEELIQYLKRYGNVILVRLPVDKEIIHIEKEYWADFDLEMEVLSSKNRVAYINFNTIENTFKTYDGLHIDKFAGVSFTNTLCDSIKKYVDIKTTFNLKAVTVN